MNKSILINNSPCNGESTAPGAIDLARSQHAWAAASQELMSWAGCLCNRNDVWLRYLPISARTPQQACYMAPAAPYRRVGALTVDIVIQHFAGANPGDLIGFYAISKDNTSRWAVIDIDRHDGDGADAASNFRAALAWWTRLRSMEFRPLLLDSNGAGGFHLLTIFDAPVASSIVFGFLRWLIADHDQIALTRAPETIPKHAELTGSVRYGSSWRLPGRHHTHNHWTRVWNGQRWLANEEAVGALLATIGDQPELIPSAAAHWIDTRRLRSSLANPTNDESGWAEKLTPCAEGHRHNTLTQLAGHFLGHGLHESEVALICQLWNARNRPPLDDDDLKSTVSNIAARHEESRLIGNKTNTTVIRIPTR